MKVRDRSIAGNQAFTKIVESSKRCSIDSEIRELSSVSVEHDRTISVGQSWTVMKSLFFGPF